MYLLPDVFNRPFLWDELINNEIESKSRIEPKMFFSLLTT